MKDKAFARSVNRDDITNGAADLGVDLEEHIAFCIEAMKGIAGELGLTREVLYRTLAALERGGAIHRAGSCIHLKKPPGM